MNRIFDAWTIDKVLVGKMFQFLVLTVIFTYILNIVSDKSLTYLLNINNESIFTRNYSLGPLGIIFLIPSALFSIWIIKGLLGLTSRILHTPIAKKLGSLKYLNRDNRGPEEWYSSFLLPLKIITMLVKALVFLILAAGSLMVMFIVFIVNSLSPSSSSRTSSGSSQLLSSIVRNRGSTRSNNKKKSQADAYWQANKKQEEADFAKKRAVDQARYNINTHHFHEKKAAADLKQHEANEAKRARNL